MDFQGVLKFLASTALGPVKPIVNALSGGYNNMLQSIGNKYTGAGLTGAEIEQNNINIGEAQKLRDWQTQMANTQYQRGVADMQAAGVNPALMFGAGQAAPTPAGASASAAGYSPAGLAELLNLMLLPAQIENIKAQTEATKAGADLTRQKTHTEEQITRIQTITAEFQYQLSSAEVQRLFAEVDNLLADTDVKVSQRDLVDSQADAQWITNKYLDERIRAEIDRIVAEKDKLSADEKKSKAETWFTNIQAKYAQDNGFLMSKNDMLLVATYFADLLGISKGDVKDVIRGLPEVSKRIKFKGGSR